MTPPASPSASASPSAPAPASASPPAAVPTSAPASPSALAAAPIAPGARVVVAFLAARTAFGLSYLAGAARDLPIPWYFPLDRTFVLGGRPATFAMEWYGRNLASAAIACAVAAALWAASARGPLASALTKRTLVVSIAQASALALIVDFAYFGWMFSIQPANPLPLPPGCVP